MQIIYVVTIFIIKWFNTTLLHFFQLLITLPNFSCFPCQVPVSGRIFSGKFLQKSSERGKKCFVYIQNIVLFTDTIGVTIAEER